jgi:hypothetical protein
VSEPERWQPRHEYHAGDIVLDDFDLPNNLDTQPGGVFRALADLRSGFVSPRYVVVDRPGEFWERV